MAKKQLGLFDKAALTPEAERLLANFEVLAEAPGGLSRFRDLILNLAAQGKLTAQAPQDEHADIILARVALAQQHAIAAGEIESLRELPSLIEEDPTYPLPDRWTWARLQNVALTIQIGPFGSLLHQSDYVVGGTPLVNPTNIRDGLLVPDPKKAVGQESLDRLTNYRLRAGDIVMGRRGEMGRCAVVARNQSGWLCGTGSLFVRLTRDMLPEFIALWLMSPGVRRRLESDSVGSTMNNLNLRILTSLVLGVPPLAEQKRIVAKVDELMKLCNDFVARQAKQRATAVRLNKAALGALTSADGPLEFVASWRQVAGNFDVAAEALGGVNRLRELILELAVRGKLVPQMSSDETIAQLLNKVTTERDAAVREGRARTTAPLPAIDDPPFKIPTAWLWVRWDALTIFTDAGWSPQCIERPKNDSEWGILKVSAVSWDAFDPGANKALPPGVAPRMDCVVHEGDFLMSRANTAALVGRSVVVQGHHERLLLSDKLVRCAFSTHIDRRYVNYFNRTAVAREHYVARASGTSDSMKNISREVILSVPVPLPPLAEQHRIVAKVDRLMALCDDLEAKLRRTEDGARKLADALVAELLA